MQARQHAAVDADVIIDEDLGSTGDDDEDDSGGDTRRRGMGGQPGRGTYGMTLEQYISRMHTTPACPLSCSGLGEEQEDTAPAGHAADAQRPIKAETSAAGAALTGSAAAAPTATAEAGAACPAAPAAAACPDIEGRRPALVMAAAPPKAYGDVLLTPTMSAISVWRCDSDSDHEASEQLYPVNAASGSGTPSWDWPVHATPPSASGATGRMSALNSAVWTQPAPAAAACVPSARAASVSVRPESLEAPAFMKPALNNSLDLRPATALPPSTLALPRDHSMDTDPATKEVDLGDLPTTLFTPSAPTERPERLATLATLPAGPGTSPEERHPSAPPGHLSGPDRLMPSASASTASASSSCSSSITAPPACPPAQPHVPPGRQMVAGARQQAHTPNAGCRPEPAAALAGAAGGSAASGRGKGGACGGSWAASRGQQQQLESSDDALSSCDTGLPAEASSGEARAASPNSRARRQIQSARPPGVYDQELDPSVWHSLERPPSRQKPPPEALHLFTPGHEPPTGKPQRPPFPVRPKTAMALRSSSSSSTPSANPHQGLLQGNLHPRQRPPSRQKPPPMSLDLEHQVPRGGLQVPACSHLRSCYKHIFTSDESDWDDEEDEEAL